MDYAAIYREAVEVGQKAAEALTPTPMIVGKAIGLSDQIDYSKPTYFVEDGVCGFAWIDILERKNSPFVKWLKDQGHAKDRFQGKGVYIWISDYNQSMQKKEAHARAMAKVLRDRLGVQAWPGSRLD